MKRFSILVAGIALAVMAFQVTADEGAHKGSHKDAHHKSEARKTITGEVVDTGCYLAHAGRGAKHVECATKCINQGMPMGLLTSGGMLYLLTMNHDNPDPYNKLKEMAGKTVRVTGVAMTRSGMKGIDVAEFKPVAESAGK